MITNEEILFPRIPYEAMSDSRYRFWLELRNLLFRKLLFHVQIIPGNAVVDSDALIRKNIRVDGESPIEPHGWTLTQSGQEANGGWKNVKKLKLRFVVEDSCDPIGGVCTNPYGGTNNNIQSGEATKTVVLSSGKNITVKVSGYVERQNPGYDYAAIFVDYYSRASIESTDSGGYPPTWETEYKESSSTFWLDAGEHIIRCVYNTNDSLYHHNVYADYEITL